jgi:hypothetical protein
MSSWKVIRGLWSSQSRANEWLENGIITVSHIFCVQSDDEPPYEIMNIVGCADSTNSRSFGCADITDTQVTVALTQPKVWESVMSAQLKLADISNPTDKLRYWWGIQQTPKSEGEVLQNFQYLTVTWWNASVNRLTSWSNKATLGTNLTWLLEVHWYVDICQIQSKVNRIWLYNQIFLVKLNQIVWRLNQMTFCFLIPFGLIRFGWDSERKKKNILSIKRTDSQITNANIFSVLYDILVFPPLKIGLFHNGNNLFVSADKVFYQIKSWIKSNLDLLNWIKSKSDLIGQPWYTVLVTTR